jgi:hypothetical protein
VVCSGTPEAEALVRLQREKHQLELREAQQRDRLETQRRTEELARLDRALRDRLAAAPKRSEASLIAPVPSAAATESYVAATHAAMAVFLAPDSQPLPTSSSQLQQRQHALSAPASPLAAPLFPTTSPSHSPGSTARRAIAATTAAVNTAALIVSAGKALKADCHD